MLISGQTTNLPEAPTRASRPAHLQPLLLLLLGLCPRPALADAPAPDEPLPKHALLRLGNTRFRNPTIVHDMALSPDEKTIVTVGNELIAWDAETGKQRWRTPQRNRPYTVAGAAYGVRAVVFKPRSNDFYTPGLENGVLEWGLASDVPIPHTSDELPKAGRPGLGMGGGSSRFLDVSPQGDKLALGSYAGVAVLDSHDKFLYAVPNNPQAPVKVDQMNKDRLFFGGDYASGQFSPNGKLLVVNKSDDPETLLVVDSEIGKHERTLKLKARMVRLAFAPDGKHVAVTERDNAVRYYDLAEGRELWTHILDLHNPYENYTSAVAVSLDGQTVAACATDNLIHLLDAKTGSEVAALAGHKWYPWSLAFTADGRRLYSAGWDGPIRRWDLASRQEIPPPGPLRATGVVAISPDGKLLAYEDDQDKVRLVDAAAGREHRVLEFPGADFAQLAFSSDGQTLAGGGSLGDEVFVATFNRDSGQLGRQWKWPKGRDPHSTVEALAFTPDGKRLAAAVFRQSIGYLLDVETSAEIAKCKHNEIYGLDFSPDGQTLTTAGWDSIIRCWDAATGKLRREVNLKALDPAGNMDLRMYAIRYSPVGNLLATQHLMGDVWIWNADDMTRRMAISAGNRFSYGSLAFSPDGLWLVAGTSAGRAPTWDVFTGRKIADAVLHQDNIYNVAFGATSGQLVTGGDDGVCYLWNTEPDALPDSMNDKLWTGIAAETVGLAYDAVWSLARKPQFSVPLLAEKLRPVETLVDLDQPDETVDRQESRRRKRLQQILVDKDPKLERTSAAHRALAALALCHTPAADALLKELSQSSACAPIKEMAAALLRQREHIPSP
jgi:WD40 repeat protein